MTRRTGAKKPAATTWKQYAGKLEQHLARTESRLAAVEAKLRELFPDIANRVQGLNLRLMDVEAGLVHVGAELKQQSKIVVECDTKLRNSGAVESLARAALNQIKAHELDHSAEAAKACRDGAGKDRNSELSLVSRVEALESWRHRLSERLAPILDKYVRDSIQYAVNRIREDTADTGKPVNVNAKPATVREFKAADNLKPGRVVHVASQASIDFAQWIADEIKADRIQRPDGDPPSLFETAQREIERLRAELAEARSGEIKTDGPVWLHVDTYHRGMGASRVAVPFSRDAVEAYLRLKFDDDFRQGWHDNHEGCKAGFTNPCYEAGWNARHDWERRRKPE